MRIGIDARELTLQPTGVGRLLAGVLEEWPADDELVLYARTPVPWRYLTPPRQARLLTGSSRLPGSVWEQSLFPLALRRDRVDALFCPAYSMPLALPCAAVVGLHDCASEATPWEFGWRQRLRRRWTGRIAAVRARYILVGSRFAADQVRIWYGVRRSRIAVAPYGISSRFGPVPAQRIQEIRDRYKLARRTVLFVGSPLKRRNLEGLIEVVAALGRSRQDLSLCIAGPRQLASERLRRRAAACGLGSRLRWLGYIDDDDLPALYAAATVAAYPSSYEGFGLPVLEALACGTPVVTSTAGSLGEIFKDRAWLVPPADRGAWSYALATLLDNPEARAESIAGAQSWACTRTWAAAARLLRQLLQSATESRPW
ncbi:MAG: glycosyltransferase family 4 protein [Acidobacteriota bacterium]